MGTVQKERGLKARNESSSSRVGGERFYEKTG